MQPVQAAEPGTGQQAGLGEERALGLDQMHPVEQVADRRLGQVNPHAEAAELGLGQDAGDDALVGIQLA